MLINGSSVHGPPSLLWESIHVPIRPPFLLVGHSVGSIYMRQFAMDYPHLTAAIVSLDGPSLTAGGLSDSVSFQDPLFLGILSMAVQPLGFLRPFPWIQWAGLTPGVPADSFQKEALQTLARRVAFTPHFAAVSREAPPLRDVNGRLNPSLAPLAAWESEDGPGHQVPIVAWARSFECTRSPMALITGEQEGCKARKNSSDHSEWTLGGLPASWYTVQEAIVNSSRWRPPPAGGGGSAVVRGREGSSDFSMLASPEGASDVAASVMKAWTLLGYPPTTLPQPTLPGDPLSDSRRLSLK